MSHEFDRTKIEELIQQAKQNRAEHMREFWPPALKRTVGGLFLLLAALLPSLKGGSGS
jgi:hypothetical protein